MRLILEVYRYFTAIAFILSGMVLLVPIAVFLAPSFLTPGYSVDYGPWALAGFLGLVCAFVSLGMNVIGIAIYDQLRAATTELEHARTEIAYLREELRGRG